MKLMIIPKEVGPVKALNSYVSIQDGFCCQMGCEQYYQIVFFHDLLKLWKCRKGLWTWTLSCPVP